MSTTIKFTVLDGLISETEFVFERPWVCTIGRADDCDVHIPNDLLHQNVSRHHCVLAVDPPDVTVRDCGSCNGTFVNGVKIGQRLHNQQARDMSPMAMPEYRLYDGDELRVGDTLFRIDIGGPAVCSCCGRDIPETQKRQARVGRGEYLCGWCRTEQDIYSEEAAHRH